MTWCPTTPREHVEKRKLENRQFALVSAFLERSVQSKLVTHGSEAWTGRPRGHRASTGRFWPFLAVSRAQRPENDQKRQETARNACFGCSLGPTGASYVRITPPITPGGRTGWPHGQLVETATCPCGGWYLNISSPCPNALKTSYSVHRIDITTAGCRNGPIE